MHGTPASTAALQFGDEDDVRAALRELAEEAGLLAIRVPLDPTLRGVELRQDRYAAARMGRFG